MKALAVALLIVLAACSSDQDPGVTSVDGGPTTTSRPLAPCPPGGPDATTPPAGCIGDDGSVVRP